MYAAQASRTAMATSMMRAVHARVDPLRLIDDPFGDEWLVQARAAYAARIGASDPHADVDANLRRSPAYPNVILRARFCEDALRAAIERGTRQYVIIGAGFDSLAQRRPDWARDLTIIEVDHPATQSFKLGRIGSNNGGAHYVAADLGAEPLGAALTRSPYASTAPAFFAWLGVTMYLSRDANLATFREMARVGARGSELVFTYSHISRFEASASPEASRMRAAVASVGEPFVCGFDPATLAAELRDCGLRLVEDHGLDALLARYDPENVNEMRADGLGRVARATI